MARRTQQEVERDYQRIRKYVNTNQATSLAEIANALNLTEREVTTSLAKHPRAQVKIMAMLEQNREEIKAQKKAEKEAHEKAEQEARESAEQEAREKAEQEAHTKTEESADYVSNYVIDASITGTPNFEKKISTLYEEGKIILTSITINELEKLQKFSDRDAFDARHLLSIAAEQPEHFLSVLIDESLDSPDNCIIKYCADNKDHVKLITGDKTMALKSRMYGVETQYIKHDKTVRTAKQHTEASHNEDVKAETLLFVKSFKGKLYIPYFHTEFRSVSVFSNGVEYTEGGPHFLKIGDEVFLSTKKPEYITFAHYKIISLSEENNCQLLYSTRIYNASQIGNLPKAEYKSFVRNFKHNS